MAVYRDLFLNFLLLYVELAGALPNGVSPSVHLLLPDNLLENFGCLFGCPEPAEDSSNVMGAIEVTGLDIVEDDIPLENFHGGLCGQNGCSGDGFAAIPHPDSKPVVVLLGEDDANNTEVVVLGNTDEQEILGEVGLTSSLLNSLFSQDKTSVLSLNRDSAEMDDSNVHLGDPEVTGSIPALPNIPEGTGNRKFPGRFEPGPSFRSGRPRKLGRAQVIKPFGTAAQEDLFPGQRQANHRPRVGARHENLSVDRQQQGRARTEDRSSGQPRADRRSQQHGARQEGLAEGRSQAGGRHRGRGRQAAREDRQRKDHRFDIVDDVRIVEEIIEDKPVTPNRQQDRRGRIISSYRGMRAGCAADMSCVTKDECGPDGYVIDGRRPKSFHVGGRGMLQRCKISSGKEDTDGFCCRNNL